MYSLIVTAKMNGVDPQAWLADVLTRIVNGHSNRDIDQLLRGPTKSKTSKPWPKNSAYESSRCTIVTFSSHL